LAKNKGIPKKPIIEPINTSQDATQSMNTKNTLQEYPVNGIPKNTRKQYKVFADLSPDTQAQIMQVNRWCKDQHITDDLEQRIIIALDYAKSHPGSNSGLSIDGRIFIDAAGKKHDWPAVLSTVNTTGKLRERAAL
jgi:hypothetical protein